MGSQIRDLAACQDIVDEKLAEICESTELRIGKLNFTIGEEVFRRTEALRLFKVEIDKLAPQLFSEGITREFELGMYVFEELLG